MVIIYVPTFSGVPRARHPEAPQGTSEAPTLGSRGDLQEELSELVFFLLFLKELEFRAWKETSIMLLLESLFTSVIIKFNLQCMFSAPPDVDRHKSTEVGTICVPCNTF